MRTRWIGPLAYIVAAAVFVTGGIVYSVARHHHATTAKATVKATRSRLVHEPYPVTLSTTALSQHLVEGQVLPMAVHAFSKRPLASVQLWDGDRMVSSTAASGRAVDLTWPALTPGPHLLLVRALDTAGTMSEAPPKLVSVNINELGPIPPVVLPATPQDSIATVSARYGLPVANVQVYGVDQKRILLQPSVLLKSHDVLVLKPTGTRPGPAPLVVSSTAFAPHLTATVNGCNLTVRSVNADMEVDEATSGAASWQVRVVRENSGVATTFTNEPVGTYAYEGRYFAKDGSVAATQPILVTIPQSCTAASGWQGNVSISQGILYLPKAIGSFHLYLGSGATPSVRVPFADAETLSTTTSSLNIASMIPVFSPLPPAEQSDPDFADFVSVEVWSGPGNVTASSKKLASGTLYFPKDRLASDYIGQPQLFVMSGSQDGGVVEDDIKAYDPKKPQVKVYFADEDNDSTHVIWQVTSVPLSNDNSDLVPFGLLMEGRAPKSPGSFTLDTSKIPRQPIDQGSAGHESEDIPSVLTTVTSQLDATGMPHLPLTATVAKESRPTITSLENGSLDAPAASGEVYLRGIALGTLPDGTEGNLGVVSNTVTVELPSSTPLLPQALHVTGFTVKADAHAPNPDLVGCVRLLDALWLDGVRQPAYENEVVNFWYYKGTYCPDDYPPTGPPSCGVYCQFGELVNYIGTSLAGVWDDIASTYNTIIKDVVEAIADYNPVCLALQKVGNAAGNDCKSIAAEITQAVVDAVLSAVGLPPSLPSAGELEDIAAGDITAVAVELMKQAGVPCDGLKSDGDTTALLDQAATRAGVPSGTVDAAEDPCTALAGAMVGAVKVKVQLATSAQAVQTTGFPDATGVPGFTVIPEPSGKVGPITFTVNATNAHPTQVLKAFSCVATLHATVGNTGDVFWNPAQVLVTPIGGALSNTYQTTVTLQANQSKSGDGLSQATDTYVAASSTNCFDNPGGAVQIKPAFHMLPPVPRDPIPAR